MDDYELERLFEEAMRTAAVKPLHPALARRAPVPIKNTQVQAAHDEAEFEAAMSGLNAVPKKDRAATATAPAPDAAPRRTTWDDRRPPRPQSTLDLHGTREARVAKELKAFCAECVQAGVRYAIIVSGKGVHSPGGVPVLRPRVEQWLLAEGRGLVVAFGAAPRSLGGEGALLVEFVRDPTRG